MSKVTYPASIQTEEGAALLMQGHNLDPFEVEAAHEWAHGKCPGYEVEVTEHHMIYRPRIKNCSQWDGWGCDNEGEWHGHWFAVRSNDDPATHFTMAQQVRYVPDAAKDHSDD